MFRVPTPPGLDRQVAPPSLLFASYWQHFWLPAWHLLGTCYLLDDLRSTHAPSKYLRATYSHIYMCYVSTSYIYIFIYICIYTYIYQRIYIYTYWFIFACIHIYQRIYIYTCLSLYIYITMIAYLEYARFQPYGCGRKKKNLEYLG